MEWGWPEECLRFQDRVPEIRELGSSEIAQLQAYIHLRRVSQDLGTLIGILNVYRHWFREARRLELLQTLEHKDTENSVQMDRLLNAMPQRVQAKAIAYGIDVERLNWARQQNRDEETKRIAHEIVSTIHPSASVEEQGYPSELEQYEDSRPRGYSGSI